jgi:hypothetical protein
VHGHGIDQRAIQIEEVGSEVAARNVEMHVWAR